MKIRITENQRILLLTESKIDDLLARYGEKLSPNYDLEHVKEVLMNTDPSPTKKYSEWIIKNIFLQTKPKKDVLEDLVVIHDYIIRFDDLSNKNQIKDKDINFYKNFNDLKTAVSVAEEKKSRKELSGQYEKVYEDGNYLMIKPLTEEASCRFGVDTKWCIASRRDNRFAQYVGEGENEFYFIIKKGEGRGKLNRIAIQMTNYGRITVWNSEDHVENPNILGMYPDGIKNFIFKRVEELRPKDCYNFTEKNDKINLGVLGKFKLKYLNDGSNGSDKFIALYEEENHPKGEHLYITIAIEEQNKIKFNIFFYIGEKSSKVDSLRLNCDSPNKLLEKFTNSVKDYEKQLFRKIEKIKFKYTNKDLTFWDPTNRSSTYTFSKPNRGSKLTKKFIEYVKEQNSKGEPATRKDFLMKNYGHAKPGFLTTFFSDIKNAGIVKMDSNFNYSIGPNYEKYLQGKLRRD